VAKVPVRDIAIYYEERGAGSLLDAAIGLGRCVLVRPFRPVQGQLLGDHATHRHAEHVGALDPEAVKQRFVAKKSKDVQDPVGYGPRSTLCCGTTPTTACPSSVCPR
jgi:hypothetical protein